MFCTNVFLIYVQIPVRKKALQKLMELYCDYCTKCSEGLMGISDNLEKIPCKILMLCYDKDCKEFRFAYSHMTCVKPRS